jgi:hypothetical protein
MIRINPEKLMRINFSNPSIWLGQVHTGHFIRIIYQHGSLIIYLSNEINNRLENPDDGHIIFAGRISQDTFSNFMTHEDLVAVLKEEDLLEDDFYHD